MDDAGTHVWRLANERAITLDRPRIVAILNVTPDSFYAASRAQDAAIALEHAERAVSAGADALDIGGESTRPGASRVDEDEQIRRVVPVVRVIRASRGPAANTPVLVDTTRSGVARAALDAGADAINDVSAGGESGDMLRLVSDRGAGVALMHRAAPPTEDRYSDRYTSEPEYAHGVVQEVVDFLRARAGAAREAGVGPDRIVTDPGLGFGKSVTQNLDLIRATSRLAALGYPVMSALSRKSFVGRVGLGRDSEPAERLAPTLGFSVAHLAAGARLFRVHDVTEHAQALGAAWACLSSGSATIGHRDDA